MQEEAIALYCGWFEGFHIAIHCIVLQENQCIAIGSRLARYIAKHCWKVKCIAMGIVLQGLLDVCCNTKIVLQAISWEGSVTIQNLYRD